MIDTDTSGAPTAPVADQSASAASAETAAGNFGSTRGSGLARGKRSSSAAAPTGTPAKSDYKPTAVEIITPQREYKNPFAAPEAASAPASEPAIIEETAPAEIAQPEARPIPSEPMFASEPEEKKAEINILPPAAAERPSVSWEAHSDLASPEESQNERPERHVREERPTFRADRREDANPGLQPEVRAPHSDTRETRQPRDPRDARQPRDPREARQPRDPRDARQPRDPRESRQPRDPRDERPAYDQRPGRDPNGRAPYLAPTKAAPGGFFGWLKSLFASAKTTEAPATTEFRGEGSGDGQRHRRRRRGGRGQGQNAQAFGGRPSHEGAPRSEGFQGGEGGARGDRSDSRGRRRHRGGQGRNRGGERSEGHQGGGMI
jgi:hypothetical protein